MRKPRGSGSHIQAHRVRQWQSPAPSSGILDPRHLWPVLVVGNGVPSLLSPNILALLLSVFGETPGETSCRSQSCEVWMGDWLKLYQNHPHWKPSHLRHEHFCSLQSTLSALSIPVPRNRLTLLVQSYLWAFALLLHMSQCHCSCSLLWHSPLWSRAALLALWNEVGQPLCSHHQHTGHYAPFVERLLWVKFCFCSHLHLSSSSKSPGHVGCGADLFCLSLLLPQFLS